MRYRAHEHARANVEGKRFQPPPPNMAAIYVYRESTWGSTVAFRIGVDERTVGSIVVDTWLRVTVAPGQHDVICESENTASVPVTMAAGEVRFVRTTWRMGWHVAQCVLDEVPAVQGRRGARRQSRGRKGQALSRRGYI